MLFSSPDYPLFLIAVFFLYALARWGGPPLAWARATNRNTSNHSISSHKHKSVMRQCPHKPFIHNNLHTLHLHLRSTQ